MEAATARSNAKVGIKAGGSALLRLAPDEQLVALTRRGNQAAFESLVSRYQSKLLGFCRHMLGSREDAEDVLQEVFAAAYTAMLADDRPIMVKPWLYRIARNRSLNHIRRAKSIGVDSMDVHVSEHGLSTADRVHRKEEFLGVMEDISLLPETQRTALMLRELDGLPYEQIAEVMDTTVPSVKSLLVRARVALAEMSEARGLTCDEVRIELGEVAEGLTRRLTPPVKRHLKSCKRCKEFKAQLTATDHALAAMAPAGLLIAAKNLVASQLGLGGSSTAGASAGASAGVTAAAGTAGSSAGALGGIGATISAGATAVTSKAAAGLAAAALMTAGAVEVQQTVSESAATPTAVAAATATAAALPAAEIVAVEAAPVAAAAAVPAVDVTPVAEVAAPVEAPAPAPVVTSEPVAPAPIDSSTVAVSDSVDISAIEAADQAAAEAAAAEAAAASEAAPAATVETAPADTTAPAAPAAADPAE